MRALHREEDSGFDVGLELDEERERETEEPFPSALRGSLEATFGADLGDVRVHHGGDASRRVEEEDAHAFARGNDIFFGAGEYRPGTAEGDHLIAHEAAHVVQQRGGSATVQRKGRTPDASAAEHEADRAADLAVARMHGGAASGERMASLGPASSGQVMHKKKQKPANEKKGPDEKTLLQVSQALGDILISHKSAQHTGEYQLALQYLEWGTLESSPYSVDERLDFLKAATTMLAPVFTAMRSEQRWLSWLQSARIETRIADKRAELNKQKAAARVEGVTLGAATGPGAIDPTAPNGVDAEAKKARQAITLYLKTASIVSNLSNTLVGAGAPDLEEAVGKVEIAHAKGAMTLGALNDSLTLALGLLELTDDEFWQKQKDIGADPALHYVKSKLELINAVGGLLNAGLGVVCKSGRLIALRYGKHEIAQRFEMLGGAGTVISGALATVTFAHSLMVLVDSNASDQDKVDATFAAVGAGMELASIGFDIGGAEAVSAALGGAAASIATTYMLAKAAADMYWAARTGIVNLQIGGVFTTMAQDSASMVRATERLVATSVLLDTEEDEEQKVALAQLQKEQARSLGSAIDWFLERARVYKWDFGAANRVASYRTLREIFEPHQQHAGKRDPQEVLVAATEITNQIAWCFENAHHIVKVEAGGGGLDTLNQVIEEERKEKEKKR